jgi:hypothetical protein
LTKFVWEILTALRLPALLLMLFDACDFESIMIYQIRLIIHQKIWGKNEKSLSPAPQLLSPLLPCGQKEKYLTEDEMIYLRRIFSSF